MVPWKSCSVQLWHFLVILTVYKKQCFQRKTMPPSTANWVGKHAYTSFNRLIFVTLIQYIENSWNSSIFLWDCMRKHNFGQNLKLQSVVVILNIRPRSPKSILFVSDSNQCIYATLVEIHSLVQKIELKKGWFLQSLKDRVYLKITVYCAIIKRYQNETFIQRWRTAKKTESKISWLCLHLRVCYAPNQSRGGGAYCFCANPFGVLVCVCVVSFPCVIFWTSWWILTKLA